MFKLIFPPRGQVGGRVIAVQHLIVLTESRALVAPLSRGVEKLASRPTRRADLTSPFPAVRLLTPAAEDPAAEESPSDKPGPADPIAPTPSGQENGEEKEEEGGGISGL